ncbi:MAG: YiiX/YebB-like N1pC/P60 family cysteine hydrolase [Burkholderiaceae bacterium]
MLSKMGGAIARYLSEERPGFVPLVEPDHTEKLRALLEPGDVILIEGTTRFSVGIKYLTQSTWSHAACYVGPDDSNSSDPNCVIEADVVKGVIRLPLSAYDGMNARICRPKGLTAQQKQQIKNYLESRLGDQYDLKNVVDLARWLFPTPPIPVRWRRRLLAFGSGSATSAICSTLIAQAFQSIKYPILPIIKQQTLADCVGDNCAREILQIRHHSLFTPRDFDLSPYFEVVKPRINGAFNPAMLVWQDPANESEPNVESELRTENV